MVSFGFHILLKNEEAANQYIQYHKNVWPEIGVALKAIGVSKMRIFFVEPLRLFMYIEAVDGFDPTKDFDNAENMDKRVEEWCRIMNTELLERLNPNDESLVWKLMDDVYNFEVK